MMGNDNIMVECARPDDQHSGSMLVVEGACGASSGVRAQDIATSGFSWEFALILFALITLGVLCWFKLREK
jgi:hypothetical protein